MALAAGAWGAARSDIGESRAAARAADEQAAFVAAVADALPAFGAAYGVVAGPLVLDAQRPRHASALVSPSSHDACW